MNVVVFEFWYWYYDNFAYEWLIHGVKTAFQVIDVKHGSLFFKKKRLYNPKRSYSSSLQCIKNKLITYMIFFYWYLIHLITAGFVEWFFFQPLVGLAEAFCGLFKEHYNPPFSKKLSFR